MGDTKVDLSLHDPGEYLRDICWPCVGTGRIRAMQSYMTYDAGSIRAPDTFVTCPACGGTGRRKKK